MLFTGASPLQAASVCLLHLDDGRIETLRRGSTLDADPDYSSLPEAIEFPTAGGLTAHAFFYPPRNRDFQAPPGEKPPLLVMGHGGPTSMATNAYRAGVQYWTSRGIAVLDVNYGGSSGFGRAYRQRLDGAWGVVDVQDCIARRALPGGSAATSTARRLIIRGGSAGGYTTLSALAFHDGFACGASLYGIGDLQTLAQDTHKFEARYLDRLVGPWPEARELYLARSPIHHLDGLQVPADPAAGRRGQGRAAGTVAAHACRAQGQGRAGGLPGVRRRAAWLQGAEEHRARARGRGLLLLRACSASRWPTRCEPLAIDNL